MEEPNHNMQIYTTAEAAQIVDLTIERVRQIAKKELTEDVDFKRSGRNIVLLASGIEKIRARNTKPGPKTRDNGRKAA